MSDIWGAPVYWDCLFLSLSSPAAARFMLELSGFILAFLPETDLRLHRTQWHQSENVFRGSRLHSTFPKPRCSEHRLKLIIMAGFPSFFKDPAIPKRLLGKPLHSEPPHPELTLTLTHFRNVQVAESGGFQHHGWRCLISEQRCFGGRIGTAVYRSGGCRNGGASPRRSFPHVGLCKKNYINKCFISSLNCAMNYKIQCQLKI